MRNNNLFILEKNYKALKDQGIDVKLNYEVEFTQDEKLYNEICKGNLVDILDKIKKHKFDSMQQVINFIIEGKSLNYPLLYWNVYINVTVNDMVIYEDSIIDNDTIASKEDRILLHRIEELEKIESENNNYKEFIKKYKAEKLFEEYIKSIKAS